MAIPAGEDARAATQAPSGLRFMSPSELMATAPRELPWVWNGYLARGAITLLAGKPKVGKSTLICALMAAMVDGTAVFLGREIVTGPVVFVTEESTSTLGEKLPISDDIRILSREEAWPKPSWAELVRGAVEEARQVGATLLVIDTLAFWSNLGADREKDAGSVQEAMGPLLEATRVGLAVLLTHHQRKAGGEDGDAIRGSTALTGTADAIIELERVAVHAPAQRQLAAISRWTATPPVLVVERDAAGSWQRITEGIDRGDASARSLRERVVRAIADHPGLSEPELKGVLGLDGRKLSGALRELRQGGLVTRMGQGVRGAPFRYHAADRRFSPESPHGEGGIGSDAAPLPEGGEQDQQDSVSSPGGASGVRSRDAAPGAPDAPRCDGGARRWTS